MLLTLLQSQGKRTTGGYRTGLTLPKKRKEEARKFVDIGVIRTPEDVQRDRERFGVLPKALKVVEAVAEQQAGLLSLDQQQRLEHLERELEAQGIEFQSQHLELLNALRERLIGQEIGRLLEKQRQEEEALVLILAASI